MLIKLKFQVPEIVIGVLLTVAIFAMVALFESSQKPASTTNQITTAKSENKIENTKSPYYEFAGWTWLTRDAAGFFTFLLVFVGGIQAWFFWVQLRFIRTSLDDTRQQFAIGHRPYVTYTATTTGLRFMSINHGPRIPHSVEILVHFKNCGLMPAKNVGGWSAGPVEIQGQNIPDIDVQIPETINHLGPLGPQIEVHVTPINIPADALNRALSGANIILVFAGVRYYEFFEKVLPRETTICIRVEVIADPFASEKPNECLRMAVYGRFSKMT